MTDMTITLPSREERRARQARLWHGAGAIKPAQRETTSYFIPNTPFGVAKVREGDAEPKPVPAPARPKYPKTFEDERAWAIAICGFEVPSPTTPAISVERIQQAVAEHFGIKRSDILAARRTRSVAWPRQVAMYLAKKLTLKSLPEIGRRFSGRDHTSILHGIRKVERLASSNPALKAEVSELAKQLGGCIE